MLNLARILSLFPFTVDVSGRKRNVITKIGNGLYGETKLKEVEYRGQSLNLQGSEFFKVVAFATDNYYRGFRNSPLGKWMQQNLESGDVIADIGANLGGYSFIAREMGARVMLFEPVPELAAVLGKNESSFGEVHQLALSNEISTMDFFLSAANIGGSSLVESNLGWEDSGYTQSVKVDVTTFDKFLEGTSPPIHDLKLVKIDVEGNEEKVIKGMEQSLSSGMIEHLWCEVRGDESDRNPGSFRAVCELLENHGYAAQRITDGVITEFSWRTVSDTPQFFDILFSKA